MSFETELKITSVGFPPQSARGCIQQLFPVKNGQFYRTLNGKMIYEGNVCHHKYATHIKCQDKHAPALQGIWRGSVISLSCLQRLVEQLPSSQLSFQLSRDPVGSSIQVFDARNHKVPHESSGRLVTIKTGSSFPIFVSYRPVLSMVVTHFFLETDEWEGTCAWSLEAVEE